MRRFALAVLLLVSTTIVADDVVDAAKAAKAKRKKSTTKVITNADVKKSKGTIAQTTLPPLPAGATEPQPTTAEQYEAKKKADAEHATKLAAAKEEVTRLEKELIAVEQQYYEENDLNRRDTEITRRFADVKKKLDAARAGLQKLEPTS